MQKWVDATARRACQGCRTPRHNHRPRQGPVERAGGTLRARTVSARSKLSLSERGIQANLLLPVGDGGDGF